ncbi:MAG: hypothetical protein QOE44_2924 [Solirubrobacteraceae bacterium]|nr:hypothetical protein [Solirubrobacteraceae bacterium]
MGTGFEYIEADDVRRSPLRVAISPVPSLSQAVRGAVGGAAGTGTPPAWSEAVRTHLREQDYETLYPLSRPGPMLIPDPLLGLVEAPGESLSEGIERMLATPIEPLADEIAGYNAWLGNGSWDVAERDPSGWLRRYATSLLRGWKGFGPVWRQARPALDREVERIGTATALDAQLDLLDGLLAGGRVETGRWRLECRFHDGRVRLPENGLVLMPLVAGERSSIVARTGDVIESIAYPVRSVLGLEPVEPPAAPLEALLGTPRAQILRAMEGPTGIGAVAESLRAVPSVATHHVDSLEAAGLVTRQRRGRNVLVSRTARGEALLEVYRTGGL